MVAGAGHQYAAGGKALTFPQAARQMQDVRLVPEAERYIDAAANVFLYIGTWA